MKKKFILFHSIRPNLPCNVISTSGIIVGRASHHKRGLRVLLG